MTTLRALGRGLRALACGLRVGEPPARSAEMDGRQAARAGRTEALAGRGAERAGRGAALAGRALVAGPPPPPADAKSGMGLRADTARSCQGGRVAYSERDEEEAVLVREAEEEQDGDGLLARLDGKLQLLWWLPLWRSVQLSTRSLTVCRPAWEADAKSACAAAAALALPTVPAAGGAADGAAGGAAGAGVERRARRRMDSM